jgi:hypothetical protein
LYETSQIILQRKFMHYEVWLVPIVTSFATLTSTYKYTAQK